MAFASAARPSQGERKEAQEAFVKRLGEIAKDTENLLDRLLAAQPAEGEIARPPRLLEAMR
jgi:hypothetical protein